MGVLKKIGKSVWDMLGDEITSMRIIAMACVPITLFDVVFCPETPILNGLSVLFNFALIILAFGAQDEEED